MKSNFIRILVLSVVSAAFLRAMTGVQDGAPASFATASSNNPAEDSFVAMWGLSPDGPILAGDVSENSNDSEVDSRFDRLWKANSERDFCVCETTVPNLPAAKPLLAIQNVLRNGEWSRSETGTGIWFSGSDQCDPDWESSLCVEAVEFSRPAQIILIGYGFRYEPPREDSFASPDGFDPFGREDGTEKPEDRLMLIGGPAALAALDGSASELVLSSCNDLDESQHPYLIAIHNPARGSLWTDFLAHWEKFEPGHDTAWKFASGLPLYAPEQASISSVVTTVATSLNGNHLIAANDGILHLCYRNSGMELCNLKQSEDGVWRVLTQSDRFPSCDDFAETTSQADGGEPDGTRLAAVDPIFRCFLVGPDRNQDAFFSFSLSVAR